MIRQYKGSDVDNVAIVWRTASELAHPFLSKEFLDKEEENVKHVYPQFAEIWVKEIDGQIIGFIAIIGNEIGAIFLNPDYHRRGIGRELMDYVIDKKGFVTLDVFKKNVIGRRFYDGYGFKVTGEYRHEPSGQLTIQMTFEL